MKLQSAPRRPPARVHKAANDYLDLYRFISDAELAPVIAADLLRHAPHRTWQLGHRADPPGNERRRRQRRTNPRRAAPQQMIGADDVAAQPTRFLIVPGQLKVEGVRAHEATHRWRSTGLGDASPPAIGSDPPRHLAERSVQSIPLRWLEVAQLVEATYSAWKAKADEVYL